jgi:hypothetical protein
VPAGGVEEEQGRSARVGCSGEFAGGLTGGDDVTEHFGDGPSCVSSPARTTAARLRLITALGPGRGPAAHRERQWPAGNDDQVIRSFAVSRTDRSARRSPAAPASPRGDVNVFSASA